MLGSEGGGEGSSDVVGEFDGVVTDFTGFAAGLFAGISTIEGEVVEAAPAGDFFGAFAFCAAGFGTAGVAPLLATFVEAGLLPVPVP